MSTREMAYSIFQQLSEKQLMGFIEMFSEIYPVKNEESTKKQSALKELNGLIRHIPNLDDEKELAEYKEEKYR